MDDYTIVETKTLEILLRGGDNCRKDERVLQRIDKAHIDGLYDRIMMDIAQNSDYNTLILNFKRVDETDPRIIFLIHDFQRYAKENRKRFEIINAYGQVAQTLEIFGVQYKNYF